MSSIGNEKVAQMGVHIRVNRMGLNQGAGKAGDCGGITDETTAYRGNCLGVGIMMLAGLPVRLNSDI